MERPTPRRTKDGSFTIVDAITGASYHSLHGAVTESRHVFIDAGLRAMDGQKAHIRVLEVGFGTELNALLTYQFAAEHSDVRITYQGIEKHPLDPAIATTLGYEVLVETPNSMMIFKKMHEHQPFTALNGRFAFELYVGDVADFDDGRKYDVVFFDAFSPGIQPELWVLSALQRLSRNLSPGAILVTYCAQGQFRRDLCSTGFKVEKIPGPPGKREMTRGVWMKQDVTKSSAMHEAT